MSTSDSRMAAGKALLASVLIGTIVVVGSVIFIIGDDGPRQRTVASAEPAAPNSPHRQDPIVSVSSTATSFKTAELPSKQASSADESLSAIHEDASALAVKLSHLASSQAQTEARFQEIATKFLGSPVKVPSYEQQQVRMEQYRSDVETQRQAVEKYENEVAALARQHRLPEAVARSRNFEEAFRHTKGRSNREFTRTLTSLIHQRAVLEAAKCWIDRMSQIQTLPPKTR